MPDDDQWPDGHRQLVPPYMVTNGRTAHRIQLDLMSMVLRTGRVPASRLDPEQAQVLKPEHVQALKLCDIPILVGEVAANLHQPLIVTKVILSDLIEWHALTTYLPADSSTDQQKLEALLDGLLRL